MIATIRPPWAAPRQPFNAFERAGRALRQQALNIPPMVVAKLGMSLGELEELHTSLTALGDAARRAGVKPLPGPAKDSI